MNRKSRKLLAELRQMSHVSQREEGLLNDAQAAAVLGVSSRRIGELVELGKILSIRFPWAKETVSVREVLERRNAELRAGRPPRSVAQKIRTAAKILGKYDAVNAVIDAVTPEPKKGTTKINTSHSRGIMLKSTHGSFFGAD